MNLCRCGCGAQVKRDFVTGHWLRLNRARNRNRGTPSEEEKAAISQRMIDFWANTDKTEMSRRMSAGRKALFASGYVNPMKGAQRPDLSMRNREDNPGKPGIRPTKPQLLLFEIAKEICPDVELEYKIRTPNTTRFLDVASPSLRLDLEYDEPYWHREERDLIRDAELASLGWMVVRFSGRFSPEAVHEAIRSRKGDTT